jgi:hypothetical protein
MSCLVGAHIAGDENPAGTVLLAAGQKESACRDLVFQELEMGGTGLVDDVRWRVVGRLQDMEHPVDVS